MRVIKYKVHNIVIENFGEREIPPNIETKLPSYMIYRLICSLIWKILITKVY